MIKVLLIGYLLIGLAIGILITWYTEYICVEDNPKLHLKFLLIYLFLWPIAFVTGIYLVYFKEKKSLDDIEDEIKDFYKEF